MNIADVAMVGRLGANALAAAGFGIACATLVGKFLCEKNPDQAEVNIFEAVKWSVIFMGSMGLFFLLFPTSILSFFTNDREVIQLGIFALRFWGWFNLQMPLG